MSNIDAGKLFFGQIPKPAGLGIIKALEVLSTIKGREGDHITQFGAGLPDHKRPKKVNERLSEYAQKEKAEYSRYPVDDNSISEAKVLPYAAAYHKEVVGVDSTPDRFVLTEGSTPALNILIKMQAKEKAKLDGKRTGENCVLEVFQLTYPLYEIPAEDAGIKVDRGIKLDIELDIQDGQPVVSKSFQLNKQSVKDTLVRNRMKTVVRAFSDPSNPSGYKMTNDETDWYTNELFEDYLVRKENLIPAAITIQDIAYLTMMHDDNYKPYLLCHAVDKMIKEETEKNPGSERLTSLKEFKETIVTVHSLSKAAAEAGDRVAYTEGNPVIIEALRESYTREMLSFSNASLYAAMGAFEAGMPDREVMKEYSKRVIALEEGVNQEYFKVISKNGMEMSKEQIAATIPFPAKSSGGFFTVMNLKPLVGAEVPAEFVDKVKADIARIDNEGIRNSFGEVFKDNKISEKDLPLYLMYKTLEHGDVGVSTVALRDGMVRFSTGRTPIDDVNKAIGSLGQFFAKDMVYLNAVKNYRDKIPSSELSELYTITEQGVAHKVAARA